MRVNTDNLNLRSSPEVLDGNVIATLPLCQEVTVVGPSAGDRFCEVETVLNGVALCGFVSQRFLREPLSSAKERLLKEAVNEWIFFERGQGKETEDPFFRRVGDYWQALNIDLDGNDTGVPWSAAFMSFIVRRAGYSGFKFSDSHDKYIVDAKKKRLAGTTNAPFWLFRLTEHKPKLGDIVCMWRLVPRTYDDLPENFSSHTDVVVEVNADGIKTIGGNVSDSVTRKTFNLRNDGFLKAEQQLFAIMRNNR